MTYVGKEVLVRGLRFVSCCYKDGYVRKCWKNNENEVLGIGYMY